jgi:ParB family chromosome partitioning protein
MSKSAPRLGKGLDALIGKPRTPPKTATPFREHRHQQAAEPGDPNLSVVRSLPVDQVIPNPHQPRLALDPQALADLANSIRANGVVQPVVVRPKDDGGYEMVAGERRWRAALQAGLQSIPAIVRPVSDAQALEIALVENLQREDLNPIERARAYEQYLNTFHQSPESLADRIGESRANVANYLRLLGLPDEVQEMVISGALSMGQARAIAGVADPQRALAVARASARRNLSVRQVEKLVRGGNHETEPTRQSRTDRSEAHLTDLERNLRRSLGVRVRLLSGRKKNSGRIVIRYDSLEEFDRIAKRLFGSTSLE